jgi:hypothetical protein
MLLESDILRVPQSRTLIADDNLTHADQNSCRQSRHCNRGLRRIDGVKLLPLEAYAVTI